MEFNEEPVGLLFFRHGVENPDGLLTNEKEAKVAIKYYYDFVKSKYVSDGVHHLPVWINSEGTFSIDLTDVILVRLGNVEEELEEEEDEDDDNYNLKHGYHTED